LVELNIAIIILITPFDKVPGHFTESKVKQVNNNVGVPDYAGGIVLCSSFTVLQAFHGKKACRTILTVKDRNCCSLKPEISVEKMFFR
jgi:hypothetical protein